MLIALVAATLLAFLAAQALPRVFSMAPAFWAHLVLAVGVMTLITAAMQHFVPVLARTRGAGRWTARLPWLMAGAGGVLEGVLAGGLDFTWVSLAAGLALGGVVWMLLWMQARARQSLGRPHAGLYWYVAAMGCLALGLVAACLMPFFPGWLPELRAFHWHINLYGFVGLTAVGTLQVLMPTAAARADPQAGARLRVDLKWAVAAALSIAVGQAVAPPLSLLGVALWGWVVGRMLLAWWRLHRERLLVLHGAEPVLLAAVAGLVMALLGGVLDDARLGPLTVFFPAFLMPLVTGAAGVLVPVWLNPSQPALQGDGRRVLNRWGGVRALLFLSAGGLPLLGYQCAGMPALMALFWFGAIFVLWLYRTEN